MLQHLNWLVWFDIQRCLFGIISFSTTALLGGDAWSSQLAWMQTLAGSCWYHQVPLFACAIILSCSIFSPNILRNAILILLKSLHCSIFNYSILLGLLVSLGVASALSLPYTPMHAILPFLCLGIGIDDMFVIMQCLNNIKYVASDELCFARISHFSAGRRIKRNKGWPRWLGRL